jgi:hypothetical protein
MRKGIYICLSILTVLIAAYEAAALMQPSRYRTLLSEKRGRVIDAVTGVGVENANVIATWRTTKFSWSANTTCDYQTVVSTNGNGEYYLPDVSKHVDVSRFMLQRAVGMEVYFQWSLAVYKAGYARMPHASAALTDPTSTNVASELRWSERPDSDLVGSTVMLEPIAIRDAKINPSESLLSYEMTLQFIKSRGCTYDEPLKIREISAEIEDSVRDLVCFIPASEVLREDVAHAVLVMLHQSPDAAQLPGAPPPLVRKVAGDFCGILPRERKS